MFISDYFSRERKVSKKSNLPCVRLWCHKVLDLIHLDQELKKAKNALFGTFTAVISLSQLRKLTKRFNTMLPLVFITLSRGSNMPKMTKLSLKLSL